MKKLLFAVCIFIFCISCHKEISLKQRLTETALLYMEESLKGGNADSVVIVRIDSISPKRKMTIKYNLFLNEIVESNHTLKNTAQMVSLTQERYQTHPNDSTKAQYTEAVKRLHEEKKSISSVLDSVKKYQNNLARADSSTLLVYGVEGRFFYTESDKPGASKPFYLFINKDFKVIEKSNFLK